MNDWPAHHAAEDFCYITTTGRRTGLARTIEIWFAVQDNTLYLLAESGERAHWVRNILAQPAVTVRLGEESRPGHGRVPVGTEDALARDLVAAKYEGWQPGTPWPTWVRRALPVAIDVGPENPAEVRGGGG